MAISPQPVPAMWESGMDSSATSWGVQRFQPRSCALPAMWEAIRFAWLSMTPFGWPVVPEV